MRRVVNRIKKKRLLYTLLLLLLFGLTGCQLRSGEELMAAPVPSGAPAELRQALRPVLKKGETFCAPDAGENRQSILFSDLDGDGQEEAVVLLQNTKDRTPTVSVYRQTDGQYVEVGRKSGCGFGFSRVELAPLDNNPGAEIVVTCGLSAQTDQALAVLSLQDGVLSVVLTDVCTDFVMLASENGQQLVTVQTGKTARLYRFSSAPTENADTVKKVPLSDRIERLIQVQSGRLTETIPAVFVTGTDGEGTVVTQVLSVQDGVPRNLGAVSSEGAVGACPLPRDIDGDGILELPKCFPLPQRGDEAFSLVKWMKLDRKGKPAPCCTTFHQTPEGWYLTIPEKWNDQIAVSVCSESGGTGCEILQTRQGEEPLPIVSILVFTGENRSTYGASEGRFILTEKGDRTYSAELGTSAWANLLSQDEVKELFHNDIEYHSDLQ